MDLRWAVVFWGEGLRRWHSIHFLSTIVTAAFSVRDVGWVKFAWVRTDSREDVALGIT